MLSVGIDAGSRAVKGVLYDAATDTVIASSVRDQGVKQEAIARALYEGLLEHAHNGNVRNLPAVATGYGRNLIQFAQSTITEITCHARGVKRVAPDTRTIVDIGGQDSKVIHLDESGTVRDFAMNDRCAAGTGRFLEVVADRLAVDLNGLGEWACASRRPAAISSMCVVFAETEIVSLLASNAPPADIAAGVLAAIARRIAALAGPRVQDPVILTGGAALVSGMCEALADAMNRPVRVAPDPQLTGALGAALLAASKFLIS